MNVLYIRDASGKFIPVPTISGRNGKSAYQYAQDGGYTGTEAEFAAKLAEELPEPYTLPVATADRLGGMMPGEGLNVDEAGRVSVEPEGEFELIEAFTVKEEGLLSVVRNTEHHSGKAYAFDAVMVTTRTPVPSSGYANLFVTVSKRDGGMAVGVGGKFRDASYRWVNKAVFRKLKGVWDCFGYNGGDGSNSTTIGQTTADSVKTVAELPAVGLVRLYTVTDPLPVGLEVKIYGVRA